MEFEIEKNVPIPDRNRYPFKHMEVGDSFLVPGEYSLEKSSKYASAAYQWSRRQPEPKPQFSVRKTEDNKLRIWRIK